MFAVASCKVLSPMAAALDQFRSHAEIDAYLKKLSPGLWQRMTGQHAKTVKALAALREDYCWHYWTALGDAVRRANERQWYLGYSLN
jgi:hypothetical protein